jgi:uncharacterized protein
MLFECGEDDEHVPPDGALRFQKALAPLYAPDEARLRVTLHPGLGRGTAPAMLDNCMAWLRTHPALTRVARPGHRRSKR